MLLPDVNVLVYAFRADSPDHARYRQWLHDVVNGESAYGISPQVLAGVVRVTTHPRIFVRPSKLREVQTFCEALLTPPTCQPIRPGPRHWQIFTELCRKCRTTGNLVQDAWLAALAIEHGCEWVSTDGDFARFPGLRWTRPF